ncbi:uncharacterized protein LOC127601499 isoform X1 [Hippocampus zosterae]|uniref:uncharacterized protein LOC127601499 isoform X1 n=1 Tax=Hippocampus zosterae TaxID=109293 RepID=UPI00223DDED4|nr:uncharacterized protein LOC127601499 isoform X1 [Hippocampus zosterae]XP_051922788.1 uncharacterized protein LOC127601499 isoform X1 [Hippocampus zosterae]XP_051922789.1 uncharacterized protein LOC127601499 isoform X1 [Hippocampus zosterae]
MIFPHANVLLVLPLLTVDVTQCSLDLEDAVEMMDLVRYSPLPCAMRGSTVTLLCSFTPSRPVVRVFWCVNHLICHSGVPSVYDSHEPSVDLRYQYLGDLQRNCTLQIHDIRRKDNTFFRFRMQFEEHMTRFTGLQGVFVTVVDGDPMRVESSASDRVSMGAAVKLSCVSNCSFHGLAVSWHRDGHALPESGPTLWLTAAQSANYTCGLAARNTTMSPPFWLNVEQHQPVFRMSIFFQDGHFAVTLGNSLRLLMVLLGVVPIVFILVKWRKCRPASRHDGKHAGRDQKGCEPVYMNATACAEERRPRQTGSGPERKASP